MYAVVGLLGFHLWFAHLNVLQYKWTNEFIIESFEFVANIVIASFAHDIFHTSHQMINQLQENEN